jgi:hypothetical protein
MCTQRVRHSVSASLGVYGDAAAAQSCAMSPHLPRPPQDSAISRTPLRPGRMLQRRQPDLRLRDGVARQQPGVSK